MSVRVGLVGVAHLHIWSYVGGLKASEDAEIIGVWDHEPVRASEFATAAEVPAFPTLDALLAACDAIVICSENVFHARQGIAALAAGKHVLCEKPLVTSLEDGEAMVRAGRESGAVLMTAFPCRFSPAYHRLKARAASGEIGKIVAVCATNHGGCPGGWFVDAALSGGGAMIDHTVHVADLLRDLLGEEPVRVQAQIGNRMYERDTDDIAMVTLEYPSSVFATLDSSWSRPASYKTWGDVTMRVIGEKGILELDMFGQEIHHYSNRTMRHSVLGFKSNDDAAMITAFIQAVIRREEPPVTGEDGLAAAKVAIAAYRSVAANQFAAV